MGSLPALGEQAGLTIPTMMLATARRQGPRKQEAGESTMRKALMGAAGCAAAVALGACATLTTGTDETVSILTDPPEASCALKRGDQVVGIANPTPATVTLEKSKDEVSVVCSKDGHFDGVQVLSSSFQARTFGNIIFGGFIGLGVDAVSGAMHEYPDNVTVILIPKEFSSEQVMAAFFDRQVDRINADADEAVSQVRKSCTAEKLSVKECDSLVARIDAERDAQLERLQTQRTAAKVEAR